MSEAETKVRRVRPRVNKLKVAQQELAAEEAAASAPPPPPVEARADLARPDMRPDPRGGEDSRARAAARAAELRLHQGGLDEGTDEFYIPPEIIPDGWSYEWKRHTLLNKTDPAYEVSLAQTGWEPVPRSRHPEFMPKGSAAVLIERKGMVLMERPLETTMEARAIEARKASLQVRVKEEQLGSAKPGQFARVDGKNAPTAKISRAYEQIAIPSK